MADFDLQKANVKYGEYDFVDDDNADTNCRREDDVEDGGTYDPIEDARIQHQQRKEKRIRKRNKVASEPKVDNDDKDEAETNKDESGFGEAATDLKNDENATNAASELGFLDLDETSDSLRMFLFQLPPSLLFEKDAATAKGKEVETSARCIEKLTVHKSGAVKLKLGDTLSDVSPGSCPRGGCYQPKRKGMLQYWRGCQESHRNT